MLSVDGMPNADSYGLGLEEREEAFETSDLLAGNAVPGSQALVRAETTLSV